MGQVDAVEHLGRRRERARIADPREVGAEVEGSELSRGHAGSSMGQRTRQPGPAGPQAPDRITRVAGEDHSGAG